jgi:hypothetical protein
MAIRTIQHPDVEIREIDISQITPAIVGTTALVMGFTPNGIAYNPIEVTSVQDLEVNFGLPQTEAERYFYYACKEVINENGNLVAMRLPYTNVMDSSYKVIYVSIDAGVSGWANSSAFSSVAAILSSYQDTVALSTVTVNIGYTNVMNNPLLSTYVPTGFQTIQTSLSSISDTQYDNLKIGGYLNTSDFIIINEAKTVNGGVNSNEGLMVSVVDPIDGMIVQRVVSNDDNDTMAVVTGDTLGGAIFVTPLTGYFSGTSVSETLMRYFPSVDFKDGGTAIDLTNMSKITVVVSRTSLTDDSDGKLQVIPVEAFTGSVILSAINPATGKSEYIGSIINENSQYIKWYKNKLTPTMPNPSAALYKAPEAIALLGFDQNTDTKKYIAGSQIPSYLNTAFEKVANINEYQIDVVIDAGLTTIAQFNYGLSAEYNPLSGTRDNEINDTTDTAQWRTTVESFRNFCQNVRKDCMAIIDAPRNLVIDYDSQKIRKTAPMNTFSNKIAPALKYITGINSSYVAIYTNWLRANDTVTGVAFWMPQTCKVGGGYVRNDRLGNFWDAPAGLNRAIIYGITDLAFNPKPKEEDQIYIKSFNYAKQYPLDGFITEGQKTSQTKPSAFDRVNVRRLFLRLERAAYQILRYFVDEPNNSVTRARVVDLLDPLFRSVKAQGGIEDYKIICDESNNTTQVRENNELRVAIGIKATRTAEFILVDFVNTKLNANFDEVL